MKTLRAFLWGSALGALAGLFLAPQRDTIAQAQIADERARSAVPGGAQSATSRETAGAQAPTAPQSAAAETAPPGLGAYAGGASSGRYVGNLNTKIYHEATDANLPNEENRAYFATPEDAEAAGYRPAQV